MIPLEHVLDEVAGLDAAELARWIERRWVRPDTTPEGLRFREVDVARVQLILEIRRECAVDEETVPLVLSLVDQIYRLRRQLAAVSDALAGESEAVRERVLAVLRERR